MCVALIFLLLVVMTTAWLRAYFMAQRIQTVLRGLAEIRIDQTTEEQLKKLVPYLIQTDWKLGGIPHRAFYVRIPTAHPLGMKSLMGGFAYRMSFVASVLVQDGKVSHVEYGLANQWGWPQDAGYAGYIVSARSVHGFWLPHQRGFEVTSVDDYSPQYRPSGDDKRLNVIYTSDAPPGLTARAFHLDLSCFRSFRGCDDAREISPEAWQDAQAIQSATYQQLISEKCPDSIVEGRMRYLPDMTVLLLEVTGSRRIEVNEEGGSTEDWFTDYKLKEVIRGQNFRSSWKNVRLRKAIPSPTHPSQEIANQIWPPTNIGSQVLFFGGLGFGFDSCGFVPATPSALNIVRNTPVPPKRPEDQIPRGLI